MTWLVKAAARRSASGPSIDAASPAIIRASTNSRSTASWVDNERSIAISGAPVAGLSQTWSSTVRIRSAAPSMP